MASLCLYQASAKELAEVIAQGGFAGELARRFEELLWQSPGAGEVRSWANSIPTVVALLVEAGLGDVQVLVEMKTPLTDVRMDLVLVGTYPKNGRMSVVVVENKQWSWVHPEPDSEMVRISRDGKPQVHPANQVWGYRQVLHGFVPLLRDAMICGIVNLHNAEGRFVAGIQPKTQFPGSPVSGYVQMFGGDQREDFKATLRQVLSAERSAEYAQLLLEAPVAPTEGLMTKVADAVRTRSVFPLLDEQREAYDYVRHLVARSKQGVRKEVVVIVGGPGTGKSVIAVELLGTLSRQGVRAAHATGSRAFTQTLRAHAGLANREQGGFSYFNSFSDATPNNLEVLIADEAHRIRETSRDRQSKHDLREAAPQIDELINAAHVPVFLLDEHQTVRRGEEGSIELIREAAERMGCDVHQINLRHQFRCGGSAEYIDWVERLLRLAPSQETPTWQALDNFTLYLAPTPAAMEGFLQARMQEGHSARIAAGFCWPWSYPTRNVPLPCDVQIGEWHRPWNLRSNDPINGVPPWPLWATNQAGTSQIGCVYSAQGFEFDYAGVIIGPDLAWREEGWRTERRFNKDVDQINARGPGGFNRIIRNTYRVLFTRGMRGTVLYSVDPATNQMLRDLGVPVLEG